MTCKDVCAVAEAAERGRVVEEQGASMEGLVVLLCLVIESTSGGQFMSGF